MDSILRLISLVSEAEFILLGLLLMHLAEHLVEIFDVVLLQ